MWTAHAWLGAVLLAVATAGTWSAQAPPPVRTIRFQGADWFTTDPEAKVATLLGHQALQLKTGEVWRRDLQFEDGSIEFDMAPRPVRSFLGLMFRVSEENGRLTYEDIYFRPMASGAWDALQYEPVFQGFGGWQLYHGDGSTAAVDIPTDRWTHVRVAVVADVAEVYVGRRETPVLRARLRGKKGPGHVGFWGFFPRGEPKTLFTANFANVRITPAPGSASTGTLVAPRPRTATASLITRWRVADPVAATDAVSASACRSEKLVTADADGMVNLGREFPHSVDGPRLKTSTCSVVESDRPRRVPLHFGFSDRIRVLLNGEPLFEGVNEFSLGYPPSLGLVRLGEHVVYLSLGSGRNELTFEIAETEDFGWGFIAQLGGMEGLTVR